MASIVPPILATPVSPQSLDIPPIAAIRTPNAITTPTSPSKPCCNLSGSIEPNILTVTPKSNMANPIWSKPVLRPSSFAPPLPIETEACEILSIAKASATRIAASAAIIATEFHNFAGSMNDNTATEAANIAMDIAIFRIAFAFKSQDNPFNTLLKLFMTRPVLFNISPRPSNAPAIPPAISNTFFTVKAIPANVPRANTRPQSILPLSSVMSSPTNLKAFTICVPIYFTKSTIPPNAAFKPLIKPCIVSTAMS